MSRREPFKGPEERGHDRDIAIGVDRVGKGVILPQNSSISFCMLLGDMVPTSNAVARLKAKIFGDTKILD